MISFFLLSLLLSSMMAGSRKMDFQGQVDSESNLISCSLIIIIITIIIIIR